MLIWFNTFNLNSVSGLARAAANEMYWVTAKKNGYTQVVLNLVLSRLTEVFNWFAWPNCYRIQNCYRITYWVVKKWNWKSFLTWNFRGSIFQIEKTSVMALNLFCNWSWEEPTQQTRLAFSYCLSSFACKITFSWYKCCGLLVGRLRRYMKRHCTAILVLQLYVNTQSWA